MDRTEATRALGKEILETLEEIKGEVEDRERTVLQGVFLLLYEYFKYQINLYDLTTEEEIE